jgi:hypothetical protein
MRNTYMSYGVHITESFVKFNAGYLAVSGNLFAYILEFI